VTIDKGDERFHLDLFGSEELEFFTSKEEFTISRERLRFHIPLIGMKWTKRCGFHEF